MNGIVVAVIAVFASASADEAAQPAQPAKDDTPPAAEGDADLLTKRNEIELRWFSARIGGGLLVDASAYLQDAESKEQVELESKIKLRDLRFLVSGRLGPTDRLTYCVGYMYDGNEDKFRFRQTGFTLDLPEVWSRVFVGRSKEGISLNKITVGYDGWTHERATANDAFIPILADGVKWMGSTPGNEVVWNLGWFTDLISEDQTYNKNDMAVVGRLGFSPMRPSAPGDDVLWMGGALRYALSNDGFLKYSSKPESSPAVPFIDTGEFRAQSSITAEAETYYRPGPLLMGMEVFLNKVASQQAGNPLFGGGELVVAWMVTGEEHPWNARGAFFGKVVPKQAVYEGGTGAFELVGRVSYTDLDDGTIRGGRFLRLTPMINWYASSLVRLELAYGFGVLDREGVIGTTHFIDSRIAFTL